MFGTTNGTLPACSQKLPLPDKTAVTFTYDTLGRRTEKRYKKTITKWVWDGNNPLHEWKEFDFKETTPDDLITWVFEEDSFAPAAKIKGDKKYSLVCDHLGTPTQGYNEEGALIWERQLDSYGKIKMLQGDEGFCNYLYQGQTLDAETGLAYNRFRYYDPEEGVYISQDPVGLDGGERLYGYIRDPLIWIDRFGLSGEETLKPGKYAKKSIPARSSERDFTIDERAQIVQGVFLINPFSKSKRLFCIT